MQTQWKVRFTVLMIAMLLALGGLFAQPPSAYAGGNLPPTGRPRAPIMFDPDSMVNVLEGISTSPGFPRP